MLFLFPQDVLDEILNLIESVSEGFNTYSAISFWLMLSLLPEILQNLFYHGFFCINLFLLYTNWSLMSSLVSCTIIAKNRMQCKTAVVFKLKLYNLKIYNYQQRGKSNIAAGIGK